MEQDPLRSAKLVSESDANRLLTRAAAVDAQLGAAVPIERLRLAAREAGLSAAAFEAALAEIQGAAKSAAPAPSRWQRFVRIAGPVLGATIVLVGGALLLNDSSATWLVRKLLDPVALGLGAAIAARLRVRPLALVLAGFAVATGAEFLMDFWAGVPAVRGAEAHFALLIAGIGGVLLGARLTRTPGADASMPAPAAAGPISDETDKPTAGLPLVAHAG